MRKYNNNYRITTSIAKSTLPQQTRTGLYTFTDTTRNFSGIRQKLLAATAGSPAYIPRWAVVVGCVLYLSRSKNRFPLKLFLHE